MTKLYENELQNGDIIFLNRNTYYTNKGGSDGYTYNLFIGEGWEHGMAFWEIELSDLDHMIEVLTEIREVLELELKKDK